MSYQEILPLRIYLVFLIIRELNEDLCTKIMHMVLLTTGRNAWNQSAHFGKATHTASWLSATDHVGMLAG